VKKDDIAARINADYTDEISDFSRRKVTKILKRVTMRQCEQNGIFNADIEVSSSSSEEANESRSHESEARKPEDSSEEMELSEEYADVRPLNF